MSLHLEFDLLGGGFLVDLWFELKVNEIIES